MYTKVMELNYWGSTTATSASATGTSGRSSSTATARRSPSTRSSSSSPSVPPACPSCPRFPAPRSSAATSTTPPPTPPGPTSTRARSCRHRLEQLRPRHLRRALGGRRRRHHGAAQLHPHRAVRLTDGSRVGDLYSERALAAGVTTFKGDTIFASLPFRILHTFQIPTYEAIAERDADFYARLEKAGFDLDWGDDGSGLFLKYLRRGSGYYIDVGASELVASGDVKLAKGQVTELTEDEVVLGDGTRLPADLVVYATGYGSMNQLAAGIIGQDMADKVGKVWGGLGSATTKDPRPVGGRAAQHVEAHRPGGPVDPRRQPRAVPLLLALPGPAAQGPPGGHPDAVYNQAEVHHTE